MKTRYKILLSLLPFALLWASAWLGQFTHYGEWHHFPWWITTCIAVVGSGMVAIHSWLER